MKYLVISKFLKEWSDIKNCYPYYPFPAVLTSFLRTFIIKDIANNGRNPPFWPYLDKAFFNEEATAWINKEAINAINEAAIGAIIAQ